MSGWWPSASASSPMCCTKPSASRKLPRRNVRSMRWASSRSSQWGACTCNASASARVSGGMPPRHGVQVFSASMVIGRSPRTREQVERRPSRRVPWRPCAAAGPPYLLRQTSEPTNHRTRCPYKGEASYWNLRVGSRTVENAVWSYEDPIEEVRPIAQALAFYWAKVDHWFEEDEEIFGHPRDPYHRVDVRQSSREVRVEFAGEIIARTRRALFLFETGLPVRYYIPPADLRMDLLTPSRKTTVCPYKGNASYWSLRVGDRAGADAAWAYMDPLPECPRIKGHLAFYPEKVDRLEVEGE